MYVLPERRLFLCSLWACSFMEFATLFLFDFTARVRNLDARIKETTAIHQIFGGYLQSQVKCSRCRHESNTFDPMLDISLDIKNADSVERAFANFIKTETLTKANRYKC